MTPDALPANQSVNVSQLSGTAASVNSGAKDAGTLRVVLATDQPALTNKLLVTPDSVALPANQSVNVAQLVGTATSVNSGTKDAGTLRVVIATDQVQLTNKLLVTPDSVALPANQSVNVAQMGAVATSMNTGVRDTGTQRVTIATNDLVPVSPPTLTKGTQGATGFSTQDLKDAGRLTIALTIEFAFAQTAETLLTVTESRGGAATGTFTSKVITSGKRIRFTGGHAIIETLGTGTTVPQRMYLRLRTNNAGATTAASPLQFVWGLGISTGSAAIPLKSSNAAPIVISDGVEYAGDGTATYGLTLETPDWVVTTGTGRCKITLYGFEY